MTRSFTPGVDPLLAACPLFEGLDHDDLASLSLTIERRVLTGGSVLFRQGQRGGSLYIVAHGRLQITVSQSDGSERIVAEIARGESVGEMALLSGDPRSATVRAIRDSLVLRITRADFDKLTEKRPQVLRAVANELVTRVARGLGAPNTGRRPMTLAVLAVTPGARTTEFARALAAALSAIGPTRHVDRSFAVTVTSHRTLEEDDGSHESQLGRWLSDEESRYRYVLYEADPAHPGWTRRCLRQADRIVWIADPGDPARAPGLSMPDHFASALGVRKDLVFAHADRDRQPAGTAKWLEAAPELEGSTHHVALSTPEDFARLARLLTGNATGLVLGGGGARGFAHIGVIRALEEARIPIDSIGGTSAGAIIGAQFACGWDRKAMLEATRRGFLAGGSLLDFTIPVVSFIAANRFLNLVRDMYGDRRIEDLWTRFFSVACSLTHGEPRVLRSGPLWRRVGASMALPGIGPPVCERGELLIDGGVLMNLPVAPMKTFCEGRLIAVSVSPEIDLAVDPAYELYPSALDILRSRFGRGRRKLQVPTILSILARTGTLGREAGERDVRRKVDLYLEPDLSAVDLLEFSALDRAEEIGYRYAVEKLEKMDGWRTA
ncbi:MAG: patatin-like phospholipase family protein [Acidobacteriota bacterium]